MSRALSQPRDRVVDILLVDDHSFVRAGIRACLAHDPRFRIVGEAADGQEGLELAQALSPDIVVLDLILPRRDGLDVAERLRSTRPRTKIIVLTMHGEPEYVKRALDAGVRGYVLKDAPASHLKDAIEAVLSGKSHYSRSLTDSLVSDMLREVPGQALTRRERQVLALIAGGARNKDVARRLGVSLRTVESHRERLGRKLGVRTALGLARYAIQSGLLPLTQSRR